MFRPHGMFPFEQFLIHCSSFIPQSSTTAGNSHHALFFPGIIRLRLPSGNIRSHASLPLSCSVLHSPDNAHKTETQLQANQEYREIPEMSLELDRWSRHKVVEDGVKVLDHNVETCQLCSQRHHHYRTLLLPLMLSFLLSGTFILTLLSEGYEIMMMCNPMSDTQFSNEHEFISISNRVGVRM